MEGDVRWHHSQTLASGQVVEFKVWAELVRQSMGGLHVFLPLRDVGIDGVLHHLQDGAYFPVQVKGRTSLTPSGQVHITVTASILVDDSALLIGTLVDGAELGSMVLVVEEAEFRRLAAHDWVDGREYLTAAFELHAGGDSRWAPYLVARDELAGRFGASPSGASRHLPINGEKPLPHEWGRAATGFVGEAEVIRRLAEVETLGLFRPFPDLETVEVLARDVSSHAFAGLQVKTSGFDAAHAENRVYFRISSFRAAPTTWVCVLGWSRDDGRFADDFLLIPSADVEGLTRVEGQWMVLELEPGAAAHRRLDGYRLPMVDMGRSVATNMR
jgi:hypothetical protein